MFKKITIFIHSFGHNKPKTYIVQLWNKLILLFISLALHEKAIAQLTANFSANPPTGCAPMVVQFTDISTGSPTSWSWDFGNGNTSTLQNPSATFTTTGQFTIKLTVSNGSSSNTKTMTNLITVYPSAVVDFTVSDTAFCPGTNVQFTDLSTLNAPGNGSYVWNYGNGVTQSGQNPSYTFNTSGYWTITHIVTNSAGCVSTLAKTAYIHVFDKPNVVLGTPFPIVCGLGQQTPFVDGTTGTPPFTYYWTFGDGGTSTQANPTHVYNAYGSYPVKLTVTDGNGCTDSASLPFNVVVVPTQATYTISPSTSICEGDYVLFTNTTPYSIYHNFTFGDGSNDSTSPVSHQYPTAGTYTTSILANNGTCYPYATQTIVVHPKPTVSFTANVLNTCPAPAQVSFTNNTQNGATYIWDFGDGSPVSSQTNPTHTYQTNGYFNVTLSATSPYGCVQSLTQVVKIRDIALLAIPDTTEGCIPLSVHFTFALQTTDYATGTLIPYPYSATSYFWDFGDGTTSTTINPNHIYTTSGTHNGKLVITTANGCVDTALFIIHTGTPPTADFTSNKQTACVDEPILFQNLTSNALTYFWNFGDGGTSSNPNPTYSYTTPGVYTVKLVASNNGCNDTIIKTNYITINFPKSIYNISYSCDTITKVVFTNNSLGATSSLWIFGDGTTSTATSPTHIYPPGQNSYTAQLISYNTSTGCTDTSSKVIDIIDLVPDFSAPDTAICPGETVVVGSTTVGANLIYSYDWKFDNTWVLDTTPVLSHTFFTPGLHTITLRITDLHGCMDSLVKTNYIIVGHPSVNFVASDSTLCAPDSILFTSTTTFVPGTYGTQYTWALPGTTLQSTTPTTPCAFPNAGNYDVKLYVTDNIGCIDSFFKPHYIQVHYPVANIYVPNPNACLGAPILILNNSNGTLLSSVWNLGDGTIDTSTSPNHVYTQVGTYTISLKITDNFGCIDTITKPNFITVHPRPDAAFTVSDSFRICPPLTVQVSNNTTGAIINNWDMGDGTAFTSVNPSHIYITPGAYTIRLVAINSNGCKDTATKVVKLLGYNGSLTYTPLTGCAPLTVTFTANVTNVPGFIFDFSDGTTLASTSNTVTHTYLNPGPVVPRVIMTDNMGCSATSYGLDTIKVDGIYAGFTYSPYPACDSGTITFQDTSKGAYSMATSRLWTFHDGQTSTAVNPTKHYGAGSYPIMLITHTNTGCIDTLLDTLTFHSSPIIDAGLDTLICVGDSVKLVPSGGVSYTWSPGATLSCTNCTNPYAAPISNTLYTVVGKNIYGCSGTDTVRLTVKNQTYGAVSGDAEICNGDSVQLLASGGTKYIWTPDTWLSNPTLPGPMSKPKQTITYIVIIQEGACIPDTGKITITVHPTPTVDAGKDQVIVAGETAQLEATGTSVYQYRWTPASSLSCDACIAPVASPKQTTVYKVIAVSDFGCKAEDTVKVTVLCKDGQVFMPNTFTPNNDGENDRFYPRGKGLQIINSFRIYNRWGELIFEQRNFQPNDINKGWDGTYKGALVNPDVFIYVIDAICDTGDPINWKGDISLIR